MSARLSSASALLGAVSLAASGAAFGACMGPGAPSNTETKCLTAVQIPGNPLRSYDISWVDQRTQRYYLADRSNAVVDVIDARDETFVKQISANPKFAGFTGSTSKSGPNAAVTVNEAKEPTGNSCETATIPSISGASR